MAPSEGWHPWAQPSHPFLAANRADSSFKCSRDSLASSSQNCSKDGHQKGSWFESRRCQKNFTKKTFFAISKNVKYVSLAYPWPKLWAFWVLLLSHNCTTVRRNSDCMTARQKEVLALNRVSAALEHVSVINAMPLQGLQAHLSHHIARCKLSMHTIS